MHELHIHRPLTAIFLYPGLQDVHICCSFIGRLSPRALIFFAIGKWNRLLLRLAYGAKEQLFGQLFKLINLLGLKEIKKIKIKNEEASAITFCCFAFESRSHTA